MVHSAERAGRAVVLVTQTYFPAIDGSAVLIQHLAEQFAACGDEVHVITTDALGPAGFRTRHLARTTAAHIEDVQGVRVHRLPTHWWLSSISRPVQAVGRRLRLPGAERIGDLYLGPLMRGLLETLRSTRSHRRVRLLVPVLAHASTRRMGSEAPRAGRAARSHPSDRLDGRLIVRASEDHACGRLATLPTPPMRPDTSRAWACPAAVSAWSVSVSISSSQIGLCGADRDIGKRQQPEASYPLPGASSGA